MSLRNRARRLQQATGLTYQQALAKLRALGQAPAELRAKTGWPLWRCDLHLSEPPASTRPAPPQRIPIEVVDVTLGEPISLAIPPTNPLEGAFLSAFVGGGAPPFTRQREDAVRIVCEQLLRTAAARSVLLIRENDGTKGALVSPAGFRVCVGAPCTLEFLMQIGLWGRQARGDAPRVEIELQGIHREWVEQHLLLVIFDDSNDSDDSTSLGLVRLRARQAVEQLAKLLREERKQGPLPPASGSGGTGGLPAEVRDSLATARRKKPPA